MTETQESAHYSERIVNRKKKKTKIVQVKNMKLRFDYIEKDSYTLNSIEKNLFFSGI